MKLQRQRKRARRGAAAVEFALVAPILFLLILSCVEFGRALLVKQILTNASRAAARDAALPNGSTASATAAAEDYAEGASITGITVTLTPSPSAAAAGDQITAVVSIPHSQVGWLPTEWFMGGLDISGTSVMRKEGFE